MAVARPLANPVEEGEGSLGVERAGPEKLGDVERGKGGRQSFQGTAPAPVPAGENGGELGVEMGIGCWGCCGWGFRDGGERGGRREGSPEEMDGE